MEILGFALTAVHVLAAVAWLGGVIFHIVVVDPVFRKNEVSFRSAFLLALMERRFRKLVGTSIALLVASGAVKAYLLLGSVPALWTTSAGRLVLLKIGLTAAMLVIFAVCPKTTSCSAIPGVCDVASGALLSGKGDGTIRERSKVVLPKVALALGVAAVGVAIVLRG
ncbi:MAG: CopD family protein [Gemmatimonadota bacterium]